MLERRFLILVVLCSFLTVFVSADEIGDEDVEIKIPEEFDRGEVISPELVVDHNHSHSNLNYSFRFGGDEIESSSSEVDYKVLSNFDIVRACVVQEDTIQACDEAEGLESNEPEDFVDIRVRPQPVEQGEMLEVEASVDGEIGGELVYDWEARGVSEEVPDETSSNEISFDTWERDPREESTISVNVLHEEYGVLGSDEEQIRWDLYRPDVEDYDVEYGDGQVQIKIADDYSDTIRDLRFGESLEGWSKASVSHRNTGVGGVNLNIKETRDYEAPDSLEVYSVLEFSGQNIEEVAFEPREHVSKEWMEERDLLIGDRNAKLNYYKIRDGDWVRLESRIFPHDREGEMVLDSRPTRYDENGEENYVLDGSVKMAIAGNPDRELDTDFAVGSDGECDRFEDGEPIPPGWNTIETTCEIHRQSQAVKEDIDRFKENMRQQANRTDTFALPEDFDENLSDIRETASDYEIEEARTELEQYQEEVGNVRRVSRRGDNVEEQFAHIRESFAGIPEEHLNEYNRSEEAIELRDEIEQNIEENETAEAFQKMQTLEEKHLEKIEQISQRERLKDEIERLRNTQDLEENHTELLNEAEQDLEGGNVRVAQEKVSRVGQDFEREMFRQMIREIVVDILRDVLPFDIGESS